MVPVGNVSTKMRADGDEPSQPINEPVARHQAMATLAPLGRFVRSQFFNVKNHKTLHVRLISLVCDNGAVCENGDRNREIRKGA